MSDLKGYKGRALEFLRSHNLETGDTIKVVTDITFEGILMPRYEGSDDNRIVLKLTSGYNVGVEIEGISDIQKIPTEPKIKTTPKIMQNKDLSKVLLLSTGGTIASRIDYRTGAVTPIVSPEELNESIPELSKIADIKTEVLFSEYSENLQPQHWLKIAHRLSQLANSDFKGIIIAHGTDTMHYTASFLSFALCGYPIPIALVGSQRSSDRPSSDAALNLIGAARFLVECNTQGVFVIMHHNESDETIACHLGTRVRKMHTSKRGAFQTIGGDPAFLITETKIIRNLNEGYFKEEYNPRITLDTNVALVKYYPGYNPEILDHIIESGTKAIIFEGTGLGHVGRTLYESIKKGKDAGIFMGMTSQCIDGRVGMTVYESGRDLMNLGITPLADMIAETALVKAMWALGRSQDSDEIKKIMLKDVASEISY